MTIGQGQTQLVLASQSPARLATLRAAGIEPEVVVSGVDESTIETRDPAQLATELAQLKCRAVAAARPEALVLGCDSVLQFDDQVFGKPQDEATAIVRWKQLRGQQAVLHTGHCLRRGDEELVHTASTTVQFADDVSDDEIAAYVATGEPLAVAGGFTIDGLGGAFINGITGDHHNVVGLSLPVLRQLLNQLNVYWPSLWNIDRGT